MKKYKVNKNQTIIPPAYRIILVNLLGITVRTMYDFESNALQGDFFPIRKCNPCGKRDSHPHQQVALNSATGGVGPLPIITTLFAEPISVVNVTVNTSSLRRAAIWLSFTSIICLPLGISVTLNFQIKRSINGGAPVNVGSTYTFSTIVDLLEAEAFSFQFFDPDVPTGNVTYFVELSTNSVIDITPGLTITNATLTALAVDNG